MKLDKVCGRSFCRFANRHAEIHWHDRTTPEPSNVTNSCPCPKYHQILSRPGTLNRRHLDVIHCNDIFQTGISQDLLIPMFRMIAIFDEDGGGDVDFQEFVSGLSAFSSKGNKEEKLRFAFKVYDIDRDGYISNGELFIVLKMMVGNNLKDMQLQQIVDKTIMEADKDGDGKISFEEFTAMVENTDVSLSMTLGMSNLYLYFILPIFWTLAANKMCAQINSRPCTCFRQALDPFRRPLHYYQQTVSIPYSIPSSDNTRCK